MLGSCRWVFLYYDREERDLDIVVLENDNTPAMDPNTTPILVLDMWEHAYYVDVSIGEASLLGATCGVGMQRCPW